MGYTKRSVRPVGTFCFIKLWLQVPQNRSRSVPGPTVLTACVESRSEASHGFTGTTLISHTSIDTDFSIVLSCPNNIYACGQYDLESCCPKDSETYWNLFVSGIKEYIHAIKQSFWIYSLRRLLTDNCNFLIHRQTDWNIRQLTGWQPCHRKYLKSSPCVFPALYQCSAHAHCQSQGWDRQWAQIKHCTGWLFRPGPMEQEQNQTGYIKRQWDQWEHFAL